MKRLEILENAAQCVCADRENQYGSPEDNFGVIANLWSIYKDVNFSSEDVAIMMALLKIARIKSGKVKADSFIDLAGYAACGGEIATKEAISKDELDYIKNDIEETCNAISKIEENSYKKIVDDVINTLINVLKEGEDKNEK